ncbi:MerR family transcriptional regulator [Bacillus cereus]|uniref:MerR family transcriptional regulator n=1 Tax=Bacillus thuringiensis serovar kumamotoensis TaxID=132267 RepID=A0A9X6JJH6_BACUK|nr:MULTISPECIES: MerR family transcriptional regulator [Bacillus cereus group]MCH5475273.1 MerR family transcriptional regulator [Bacillus cereus]MCU4980972.1 MerR family transcriptional regulator [Bacillus cereus]MCU5667917.1 MerR family transcriptional regulator [Bacillus cereus]MEC2872826.1 MerR family transcriptional regulator [Bacillus cereus]OTZ67946.1 MerR family transcriptional regulator [Bacillus thuringiensis serovar kumamtoensis]
MIEQDNKNTNEHMESNNTNSSHEDTFEKAWRITEFSKLVGRHHNTVYNWFNILEEKGLHGTLRTNNTNEKLYNTLDLDIALFIKLKRDEKWSLDAIIELLPHQFELRPVSPENQTSEVSSQLNMQEAAATIEKIVEQKIQMHLQNIELEYQGKFEEAIRAVLPEPEDPEKLKERQRQERLDNIIIQHRARTELRKQAENEWNTQPEETRIKKVGWFKKEEDLARKQLFIENYIDENMIEYMKNVMKIEK